MSVEESGIALTSGTSLTPLPAVSNLPEVEFKRQLMVGGEPFFPRIIEHRGEPLAKLQELGFNCVRLDGAASAELLSHVLARIVCDTAGRRFGSSEVTAEERQVVQRLARRDDPLRWAGLRDRIVRNFSDTDQLNLDAPDPLCDLDLLRPVLAPLRHATLLTIPGGDHSFRTPRRNGTPDAVTWAGLASGLAAPLAKWLAQE